MAVATPILERQTLQQQSASSSLDELHNAQIKENYRRLMDANFAGNGSRNGSAAISKEQALEELRASILRHDKSSHQEVINLGQPVMPGPVMQQTGVQPQPIQQPIQPVQVVDAVRTAQPQPVQTQPYLVTNARADSDLFRADSPINQHRPVVAEAPAGKVEEDENEDLRPTMTTIQYKNITESDKREIRAMANEQRNKHVLERRDKIIIATFVSIVVALFVLVIVNSAVIAGLNGELSTIQTNLNIASETFDSIVSQIADLTSMESIANYAQANGLVLP